MPKSTMTIEEYRRLAGVSGSIIEMLASPGAEDIDFDPPRLDDALALPADFN